MSFSSKDLSRHSSYQFPFLGCGIGARPPHYSRLQKKPGAIAWVEAISENYMGIEGLSPGRPLKNLEKIRETLPVVLHGVSLSVGSTDPLNKKYLNSLKKLIKHIEPAWVSDHLCWTGAGRHNVHDLLPLPYTAEAISHVSKRIQRVQEFLGRRILIENVSSYVEFKHSKMQEWEFLSAVLESADCGVLLDINNIYVSSVNHGFDPKEYIRGIPRDRIGQIHLAGHSNMGGYLIDTHDHPVSDSVWDLFRYAIKRFGPVSTLIERDDKIPKFQEMENEVRRAKQVIYESTRPERTRSQEITALV